MNVVRVYEVEIQEHTFRMSHEEVVALYAELAKLVGPPPGKPTYPPGGLHQRALWHKVR